MHSGRAMGMSLFSLKNRVTAVRATTMATTEDTAESDVETTNSHGEQIPVALQKTTKNYAEYESEDPLDGRQQIISVYFALERFDGEPPEYLTVTHEAYDPS